MTLTLTELLPYAGALALLVATPGPVVAALIARSATGGVRAAVPLAAGVGGRRRGLAAPARMLGIGVVAGVWAELPAGAALRRRGDPGLDGGAAVRTRRGGGAAATAGGLGRESGWAGFTAGLMVIAGNPKAILFYMGVLPGFFDFRTLTPAGHGGDLPGLGAGAVPRQPRPGRRSSPGRGAGWPTRWRCSGRMWRPGLALVAVGVAIALG